MWCCGNEQSITDGGPSASAQQVKEANKVKRSSKGQIGIHFWEGWFCHGEVTNSLITFFSSTIVAEADDWTTISFCDQIHHWAVDQTPELEIYKREAGGSEKGVHSCPRNSLCQFKNTWMHSSNSLAHLRADTEAGKRHLLHLLIYLQRTIWKYVWLDTVLCSFTVTASLRSVYGPVCTDRLWLHATSRGTQVCK